MTRTSEQAGRARPAAAPAGGRRRMTGGPLAAQAGPSGPVRAPGGDRPCPGASSPAFTLAELLVVMGILAIIFGISAARLARVGSFGALDGAERIVRAALHRARASAREQSALASATFLPDRGEAPSRIALTLTRDAGSWHFDVAEGSRVLGGRNNWARLQGAALVEDGRVRSGAELSGGGQVVCDPAPGYDPVRGFSLSMDVWPEQGSQGAVLFSYGEAFSLELDEDGALAATLRFEQGPDDLVLSTARGVVDRGAWARVELLFDGYEARIRAHGVVEARKKAGIDAKGQPWGPGPFLLASPGERDRLTFGSPGFHGVIDEVLYRTVEDDDVMELQQGVELALQSPLEVRFGDDGRLDPRFHAGEVLIPLRFEDQKAGIRVDLSGVIR